jgi:hypothetical protein
MPAGQSPARKFYPIDFGGVLDESRTPAKIGAGGLVGAQNLTYRRYGAWGKRAGSGVAYASPSTGILPTAASSGIRWYAEFPPPGLTRLVVATRGQLYTGNDPLLTGAFSPLTLLGTAVNATPRPVGFAAVRDPSWNGYAGADILIITGLTGPYGFATGTFTLSGTPTAGQVVTLQATNPPNPTQFPLPASYTVLQTDNVFSIAQALVASINDAPFVVPGLGITPFLGPAYAVQTGPTTAVVHIGALVSGVGGNSITYSGGVTGSGLTITPTGITPANMAGGGSTVSAPLRYDGTTLTGLSYMIQQPFTNVVTWHDHVWFWGDENNPDTLYATDINTAIGFTFMLTNGPYDIGSGDGDPGIQNCFPVGNLMYVMKTQTTSSVTGYDFQSGEYEFQIQYAIVGSGIPAPNCAALMHNNAIVYWDGGKFSRLWPGASTPENLARTIPLSSGKVAMGNPALMRTFAGDFPVKTMLNDNYAPPGMASDTAMMTNIALFACDVGNGVADTIFAYDDDASNSIGNYAWSFWTGLPIAAWIPFGTGATSSLLAKDQTQLMFIPVGFASITVNQFGADPSMDAFNTNPVGIPWDAIAGWDGLGTPALTKDLHRMLLDIEANPGAVITVKTIASGPVDGVAQTIYSPASFVLPTTVGTAGSEANQTLIGKYKPALRGYKYIFAFSEPGNPVAFELSGALLDCLENAFVP